MKNSTLIIFLSIFSWITANGQLAQLEWVHQLNSVNASSASTGYVMRENGNILIKGFYKEKIDYDDTNIIGWSEDNGDGYLIEIEADGDFSWIETFQGQNGEVYNKIGSNGNIIYHSGLVSNMGITPGEVNIQEVDLPLGNKLITVPGSDIAIEEGGNVLLSGGFQNSMDLDKSEGTYTLNSLKSLDAFLVKYDSDLNVIWGFSIPGKGAESASVVRIDNEGYIYMAANFRDSIDIDPNTFGFELPNDPSQDNSFYLCKYSPNGQLIWYKPLNGMGSNSIWDITFDSENRPIITGGFKNELKYTIDNEEYTFTSNGGEDSYIAKLTTDGDYIWMNQLGATEDLYSLGITVDDQDRIYAFGSFYDRAQIGPQGSPEDISNGFSDSYIQLLDTNGGYITHFTYGGVGFDWIRELFVTADGFILISQAGGQLDVDLGDGEHLITPSDFKSTFIAKYSLCSTTEGYQSVSICEGDSIIINNDVIGQAGTYTQELVNSGGCDSILITEVSVLGLSFVSISDSICPGDTLYGYFEEGIYENVDIGMNGCDSMTVIELNFLPASDPACMSVGIENIDPSFVVSLAPNPTRDRFEILTSEPIDKVAIYDIHGIKRMDVVKDIQNGIDISTLNSGLYLVQIQSREKTKVLRIIKE